MDINCSYFMWLLELNDKIYIKWLAHSKYFSLVSNNDVLLGFLNYYVQKRVGITNKIRPAQTSDSGIIRCSKCSKHISYYHYVYPLIKQLWKDIVTTEINKILYRPPKISGYYELKYIIPLREHQWLHVAIHLFRC